MAYDSQHIARLSQRLKSKISDALDFVVVNGDTEHSYPGERYHKTFFFVVADVGQNMLECLSLASFFSD
jgi:hypothetical protein